MGTIVQASFDKILPLQGTFEEKKLARVILYAQTHQNFIIPVKYSEEKYISLDGHHRLLYQRMIGTKEISLYLAENAEDGMTKELFPDMGRWFLHSNNLFIKSNFSKAEYLSNALNVKDYNEHFDNLCAEHIFLASVKSCKKYFCKCGIL